MKSFAWAVVAVVAGFAAACFTLLAFVLISMLLESLRADGVVPYGLHVLEGVVRGFAFVFVGSLFAPAPRRALAGLCLVPVGIAVYTCGHFTYGVSSHAFPFWHLTACVAGGLLATAIQAWRAHKPTGQPTAPPNGGPATGFGNSGIVEGPPSVS